VRIETTFFQWSISVAALLAISLSTQGVRANKDHKECSALAGPFTSTLGAPCSSPLGLCTHGKLSGELEANYDFTFLTLVSANDPADPTKSVYTGTSVVTFLDGSGVLYTDDTGTIHTPVDGSPAPFVTKAIVDHGTKRLHQTIGGFVAVGLLEFQTGIATGNYSVILCSRDK